ncbi:hypothetical protein Tco_0939404 [Tanacetum coccineum]|uniref:Uncharacterized protein n=1 Tax=Tanacetum coccineum TaxID=301880 RepID=A0ABQ5DR34_9ASTR
MVTEIFKLLRESLQPPPQAVQLCQHFHNMKSMKLLGREFREANSNHNCQTIDEACPELEIMESSSRIQLTDTIFEIPIPRPDTTMIGSSNQSTGPYVLSLTKAVKALLKVHLDPDTPIREEATKAGVDPKIVASAKRGQEFRNIQDAEIKVHNREHSEKIKRSRELRKKRIEKCRWTTSSRLKPETITDVKIHPITKPVVITIFRGTNKRNFDVHNPFNFGNFSVTEWDELRDIIPKKKNKVMQDLMNSLSKRYEKLGTIPDELGIRSNLPAPTQILSITLRRKRKHQELEPKTRIPGLECNRFFLRESLLSTTW